jgi:phthalate 4,5-dioxygenase reductase subunit
MAEALNPELVAQLRVESAIAVAAGIRQFELVSANDEELPAFAPGAHLLVQAPNGATRRYSISSAPEERQHYVIAVKREANGRGGSISMVDGVDVGDLLHVSLPRNEFELKERAASYLFIAGGIGITPIRSMVHHLIRAGDKPFKLYSQPRARIDAVPRRIRGAASRQGGGPSRLGDPNNSLDLWPT